MYARRSHARTYPRAFTGNRAGATRFARRAWRLMQRYPIAGTIALVAALLLVLRILLGGHLA